MWCILGTHDVCNSGSGEIPVQVTHQKQQEILLRNFRTGIHPTCVRNNYETPVDMVYKKICLYIIIYMRVVLNSFMWKTPSSPEKKFFRQTLANPTFIFSVTCWPRLVRRTWMCDILKFAPGVWSLVTLHSVAAALKHLRSAWRCWSLLTFIGQFWHNKSTVWAT